MDYFGIIKKAFQVTFKHKYLWIFGILAGGGLGVSTKGFNYSVSVPSNETWQKIIPSGFNWTSFWAQYWALIFAIIGIMLFIGIVWWVVSIISIAGLLGSVESIEKKEKNNFRLGFIFGWHKFWRTFATSLILGLIILASIIFLVLPLVLFALAKVWILAIIYGLLVFLLDLALWIYLGLVFPYTLRLAVLGNHGAFKSFSITWPFFQKHWKEILLMYIIMIVISFGIGMALIILCLIVGGLLFGIGFAIFLGSKALAIVYGIIFGSAFGVATLILGGVIKTFSSTVYTLTYLELAKKSKVLTLK